MTATRDTEALRQDCWQACWKSYGTSTIFRERAKRLRSQSRFIDFLGLAMPIAVGCAALSFNFFQTIFPVVACIAGLVAIVQLVATLWKLIYRWDEDQAAGFHSSEVNRDLTAAFEELAKTAPANIDEQYQRLSVRYRTQENLDEKLGITDAERRFAMRQTLFKYQKACTNCKVVPTSLNASTCTVCGNF